MLVKVKIDVYTLEVYREDGDKPIISKKYYGDKPTKKEIDKYILDKGITGELKSLVVKSTIQRQIHSELLQK